MSETEQDSEEFLEEEEITPYEGVTELDQEGDPQPVADAQEDDNPEAHVGEVLPD